MFYKKWKRNCSIKQHIDKKKKKKKKSVKHTSKANHYKGSIYIVTIQVKW